MALPIFAAFKIANYLSNQRDKQLRNVLKGFSLTVTSNIKQVQKELDNIQRKQIPFATAKALTDTAWDAQREVSRQITFKFDRPTKFTVNAIGVNRATKRQLFSEVYVKDNQARYLRLQIEGGSRVVGGRRGTGLPTSNTKLNKFGNIKGRKAGFIKKKSQFIATINGVSGVWERFGGKRNPQVRLMVAFEKTVKYRQRLPFYKIVNGVAARQFPKRFNQAIRLALATAK